MEGEGLALAVERQARWRGAVDLGTPRRRWANACSLQQPTSDQRPTLPVPLRAV